MIRDAGSQRGAPIFLLGMMGSGKSTVGRALAQRLGVTFVDLDRRVERMFGASITELFEDGEPYFRACERAALRSLLDEPGLRATRVVVATGGGVVVDPANLADMERAGATVYLEVSVGQLVDRLSSAAERGRRPLLADRDSLRARLTGLLDERQVSYRRAALTLDAQGAVPGVVEAAVVELGLDGVWGPH